jgi:tetratricopeptide (TPR) repeat protein
MKKPKNYRAIMVSSTYLDLKEHRKKVIAAVENLGFKANVMEHSGARSDLNVIDTSLKMVEDSAAYIAIIGHKYGQIPKSDKDNRKGVSITELEFDKALALNRPILLFIMNDDHPAIPAHIETDPAKSKKLKAFLARAKRMKADTSVERVYETFSSIEELSVAANAAIGRLTRILSPEADAARPQTPAQTTDASTVAPPQLAAIPKYLGSHEFVGRKAELQTLDDWCGPADPHPMLLFEAMGGSGKSMLAWEWLTRHALEERSDWAGRFWYSFYERGAVMSDFCRQALSYITQKPVRTFARLRTQELSKLLLDQLERRPWLIVLDGLERILVAYHRYDAAQLPDEEVEQAADIVGSRDPRSAIRPEDDELLRQLAAVAPSKILVSSRLTPLALVNRSNLPVPGVRREPLAGLRPRDAEKLFRAAGVVGNSSAIQSYLQTNCDCHPLVVGALAGLINNYPHDRGNFDRWAADSHHGGALNLAKLDLVQRRNHILRAALDALAPESSQVLQYLSLLQGGADFATLQALNPHVPPRPAMVDEPRDPEQSFSWHHMSDAQRSVARKAFDSARAERNRYLKALRDWSCNGAVLAAPAKLESTIFDLERRGLLQYDRVDKRYDLHPVVRGITVGRIGGTDTLEFGQKVVDHFTSRQHDPWEQAQSLDDVADGLQVMRVLLRMGKTSEALDHYRSDLASALHYNLNAREEIKALLVPFFPDGFLNEPVETTGLDRSYLLNEAALSCLDDKESICAVLEKAINADIDDQNHIPLPVTIINLTHSVRPAAKRRLANLALEVELEGPLTKNGFFSKLRLYQLAAERGDIEEADRLWPELENAERPTLRTLYRPGDAELSRASDLYDRGQPDETLLSNAEEIAIAGRNRSVISELSFLRGRIEFDKGDYAGAVDRFSKVVAMARGVGAEDVGAEAWLILSRLRAGEKFDASAEAARLASKQPTYSTVALFEQLGDREGAVRCALVFHTKAAADGIPYTYAHGLRLVRELLTRLGENLPEVPVYDPDQDPPFPWERRVVQLIEKVRANNEKKRAAENDETETS